MQRNQQQKPPVDIGDELDVTIESVGEKGDGVAKVRGFVLFVPSVRKGERCRIRVTKVLQKVGFADKIGEAKTAEPERQEPKQVVMPPPVEREQYEDTEDFGEDLEEQA